MMGHVLVGPTAFGDSGIEPLDLLAAAGLDIVPNTLKRKLTAGEVVRLGEDCVGILAGVEPLTGEVLRQLPRLRCISRCGAGTDTVDLGTARELGIRVYSTPDALTQAVAEMTVGLMFALLRRIPQLDRGARSGQWSKETGFLLSGKTVGIVGLGRIGRRVAEMVWALGCRVVAAEPSPNRQWLRDHSAELLSMGDVLARSDIVSLHPALSPETRGLIGARELAMMKPSAFLVNTSRGDVLDEAALAEALTGGRLAGAALDVFSTEPYSGPLTGLDSLILTPHVGGRAREAKLKMELEAVRNLLDGLGLSEPE